MILLLIVDRKEDRWEVKEPALQIQSIYVLCLFTMNSFQGVARETFKILNIGAT